MIQINIKDMEMPKRCGLCRFTSAMDCGVTGKFIENHDEIPNHCPLKEVNDNSVLEDIKAEFENLRIKLAENNYDRLTLDAFSICANEIIDKHISVK